MKNRLKRTAVSLTAVIAMIFNMAALTVVHATGDDLVNSISVNGNIVSFSGQSSVGGEKISVFLLNDGKTLTDLNNADNNTKFSATVNYANVLISDGNGNFSERFKINNMQDDGTYLLYVKSSNSSYTYEVGNKTRIYVSKTGNDTTGDGTALLPYATITKARDVVRGMDKTKPIEVIIGAGVYNISSDIVFGSADSGTESCPITYKAASGERVVITGTTRIDTSNLQYITAQNNAAIYNRLLDAAKGKVVEINLTANGIPQSVVNYLSSHGAGQSGKPMGVYLNDNPQTIARWPNTGYEAITKVVSAGGNINDGTQSSGGAVIRINGAGTGRCTNWTNAVGNMYIEGYLKKDFHGEWAKVKSVDPSTTNVTLNTYTRYGVAQSQRIAVVNLLEEIDVPGEWYADASTMKMYYYPPHTLTADDNLEIATLCKDLIHIQDGASYINFDGIELAKNADSPEIAEADSNLGNGILIDGGASKINISNCILRDIGMDGIRVYGSDITIDGCIINNTGFSGIVVNGTSESRKTLTSRNITISNCIINGISRDTGANNRAGIELGANSVGVVIENNIFSSIPNSAIRYKGNNHIIRNNEIYNTVTKASDAGAIYAGRNWTQYGTEIRNNYFHNIGAGFSSELVAAVFWDDMHSGNTFVGNIVDMSNTYTAGIKIGGGKDNTVTSNVIVNSTNVVRGQARTEQIETNSSFYSSDPFQTFKDATNGVSNVYTTTLSSSNWLDAYKNSYNGKIVTNYNTIRNNKSNYSRANTITYNAAYNCTSTKYYVDTKMNNASTISNNVTASSSDFVDAANGDYRIKSSRKSALGLASAPDENTVIGLQSGYTANSDAAAFDLVAPANGTNISHTKTILVWGKSVLADSYTWEVATDSAFAHIVQSGTTTQTQVEVTDLTATEYYWRVKANNESKFIGTQYTCNEAFRFTTSGAFVLGTVDYNSTTKKVSYVVTNTTSTPETFTVIVALKTAGGKLTSVKAYNKTAAAKTATQTVEIDTTSDFGGDTTGTTVEVYIWDSLNGMNNLIDKQGPFDR